MALGTVREEMATVVAAAINASPDETAEWSGHSGWPTNLAAQVAYILPNRTNYLTTDIEGAGFGWCEKSAAFTIRPVISFQDFDHSQKRLDIIAEYLIDHLHGTPLTTGQRQTLRVNEVDGPRFITGDAGTGGRGATVITNLFTCDIRLYPIPV